MRDGWREATIGDVVTLEYGRALPERVRSGSGYPVYGSAGIVGWHSEAITPAGPAIIVGRKGTAGSVHLSDRPCWPIDTTYFARVTGAVVPEFAFLLLQTADLPAVTAQTGVPGLNRDRAYAIPCRVPPPAEQRRIVDLIGAVDNARRCAASVATAAHVALAAACIEMTAVTVESRTARLSDVAVILDSRRVPVSEAERATRLGEVPYYGANGQVGWIDAALFDEPLVLVAEDGGRYEEWRSRAVAYEISGPAWVNNHAHVLRATGVPHDWLYYSLRHRDLTSVVNHGTRLKLNQAPLRDVAIALVDGSERLTAVLRSLEDVGGSAQRSADALVGLRSTLLSGLLSGDYEIPASYDLFLDDVA